MELISLFSHPGGFVEELHYGINVHFSDLWWGWQLSHMFTGHLDIYFVNLWRWLPGFCCFCYFIWFSFACWFLSGLYIVFDPSVSHIDCKYHFSSYSLCQFFKWFSSEQNFPQMNISNLFIFSIIGHMYILEICNYIVKFWNQTWPNYWTH